jgi:hypothetical protein
MGAHINLEGRVFGKLTITARAPNQGRNTMYDCRCECGAGKRVMAKNLANGRTKSCGCVRCVEAHGQAKKPTYLTWIGMKQRCTNPKATGFKNYGGRGITVCPQWMKFSVFLSDMGERPEGMTLDRKDNDQGYRPDNCVWATHKQQATNRRKRAKQKESTSCA